MPRERWHTLLTGGLCAAISDGKGGDVLEWLKESGVPSERWPALLTGSLCAAIRGGKGRDVLEWLRKTQISPEHYSTVTMYAVPSICADISREDAGLLLELVLLAPVAERHRLLAGPFIHGEVKLGQMARAAVGGGRRVRLEALVRAVRTELGPGDLVHNECLAAVRKIVL